MFHDSIFTLLQSSWLRSLALQEYQAKLIPQDRIIHRKLEIGKAFQPSLSPVDTKVGSIQVTYRCACTGASGKRMMVYDLVPIWTMMGFSG